MHKPNSSTSTHTTEGESPYNAHITHYKWQQKKVFLSFALRNTFRVLKYHRATSEIFVPLDIRQSTHLRVLKRCSFFRNPSELGIKNKFYFTRGGNSYFGSLCSSKETYSIHMLQVSHSNKQPLKYSTYLHIRCLLYVSNRCISYLSTIKKWFSKRKF